MKKLKEITLIVALLSLFGCGGETGKTDAPPGESAEKISVQFEKREISFAPSYAKLATFRKGLILSDAAIQNKNERIDATVHRIYLANYDLQLTDPSKQDYRRIAAENQYRVEIQIEAEKDAPENAVLQTGEYRAKAEPFDRVSWIAISRLDEGKNSSSMLGGGKASGTVKITAANDSEISGEIDFSDADGSVKGKFTAQKLK